MENKTARLTVLIDPARKDAFEKLCHSQDMTPLQVMRLNQIGSVHGLPPGGRGGFLG